MMNVRRILGSIAAVLMVSMATLGAARSEVADAAMRGDKAAVRTLLAQHADVNAPQQDGATALHWAVYRGDKELVDALIRAGANVKAANREGATPLWLASVNGDATIIAALTTAGADPNEQLPLGRTPLMVASRTGNVEAMKVLLDRGADVNARASIRKQLTFHDDTSLHEYRDVTPLSWGQRFHAREFVSEAAMRVIADRGGHA